MNLAPRLALRTPFYYGWVVLFSAGSSQFVRNAAASLTLAVFMFPLAEELGWSRTLIAGAASLGGLVSSFASPAVGWLLDRYGARVVLTVSVLVLGLSVISLSWATVPIAFYLAYGTGRVIFSSPVQIGASVVVSRWFIRLRGRANGILTMCHSAGMVVFPLIAGLVIGVWDWQRAWIVLGVIVWAVALLPVSLLIAQRPEDVGLRPDGDGEQLSKTANDGSDGDEPEWTLKQAMYTPALWILAAATGALFLMQAGTNIHSAAYLRDQGLGQTVATLGITVNAICLGIGSLIWGWIVERVPARYVLAAGRSDHGDRRIPVHQSGHHAGSVGVLRAVRTGTWRDAGSASGGVRRLFRTPLSRNHPRGDGAVRIAGTGYRRAGVRGDIRLDRQVLHGFHRVRRPRGADRANHAFG